MKNGERLSPNLQYELGRRCGSQLGMCLPSVRTRGECPDAPVYGIETLYSHSTLYFVVEYAHSLLKPFLITYYTRRATNESIQPD